MVSVINKLYKAGIAKPPPYVAGNCQYETIMGSQAYGVSSDDSDIDIYGFCVPPKNIVFPHITGHITGFGPTPDRFDQYSEHHMKMGDKVYDVSIYNIVKYFQLCMDNNPNMIDSLYTPINCVVHCTKVGEMVKAKRDLFLTKRSWFKFKGYAFSQLHKMANKQPVGKRTETVKKYGYDVKFAYHIVRLMYEAHMILEEGTIDLQRNRNHLKAIRRGDVSEEDIREWFVQGEKAGDKLYESSSLRKVPDYKAIKSLLIDCLEQYYGSIEEAYVSEDVVKQSLRDILAIARKVEHKL